MTYDATTTQVASISPSSSPQEQEAEEVDEVLYRSCRCTFLTFGRLDT
jgi:hypothetical protein